MSTSWLDEQVGTSISVPFGGEIGYVIDFKRPRADAFELQQLLVDSEDDGVVKTEIIELPVREDRSSYLVIGTFNQGSPIKVNDRVSGITCPYHIISTIPGFRVPSEFGQLCDYVVITEHVIRDQQIQTHGRSFNVVIDNHLELKMVKNRYGVAYSPLSLISSSALCEAPGFPDIDWSQFNMRHRFDARRLIIDMYIVKMMRELSAESVSSFQLRTYQQLMIKNLTGSLIPPE